MFIWTHMYNAFIIGGNTWQPTRCEIPTPDERHDLGKGFFGYVITTPSGKTRVIEERSGGIIGDSLERVRKDISEGDVPTMERQVTESRRLMENARTISPGEFWRAYDKAEPGEPPIVEADGPKADDWDERDLQRGYKRGYDFKGTDHRE